MLDEHDLQSDEDGIDEIMCNAREACNLLLGQAVRHTYATPTEVLEKHVKDYCVARMYINPD